MQWKAFAALALVAGGLGAFFNIRSFQRKEERCPPLPPVPLPPASDDLASRAEPQRTGGKAGFQRGPGGGGDRAPAARRGVGAH